MNANSWISEHDLRNIAGLVGGSSLELIYARLAGVMDQFLAGDVLTEKKLVQCLFSALSCAGAELGELAEPEAPVQALFRGALARTRWERVRMVVEREEGLLPAEDWYNPLRRWIEVQGRIVSSSSNLARDQRNQVDIFSSSAPGILWEAWENFDHAPGNKLGPWLKRVVHNKIVSEFRRSKQAPELLHEEDLARVESANRSREDVRLEHWSGRARIYHTLARLLKNVNGRDACAVFGMGLRFKMLEVGNNLEMVDKLIPWAPWELVRQFSPDSPRVGECWNILKSHELQEKRGNCQQIKVLSESFPEWNISQDRWNQWFKRSKEQLILEIGEGVWNDVFGKLFDVHS